MHKIDTPSATPDNKFQNENESTGQEGTVVDADFMNAVQEEVISVIDAAGIALDKTKHDQLLTAINTIVTNAINAAVTTTEFATQTEGEEGTVSNKAMSPETTKQTFNHRMQVMTDAAYQALATKEADTFYFIEE